jgi:protein-disulfide isomerase
MRRFLPLLLVFAALTLAACAPRTGGPALKERIREAVRENPEMVLEALAQDKVALLELVEQGARERRDRAMRDKWRQQLDAPLEPALDPARPWDGAPDAAVTVVSYSDFLCGYCARGSRTVDALVRKYPGRVRHLTKHAPMSEHGEYAARLYEALGLQQGELALEFARQAFAGQAAIAAAPQPQEAFLALALALPGVDAARLTADMESEAVRTRVRDDAREFLDWGFSGVPVYLFNGVALEGAVSEQTMEEVLELVQGGK